VSETVRDRRAAQEPIAATIGRRGLAAPALILLEAHRPIRPLLSMGATFLMPIARPLFGRAATIVARTLDDEAAYDRLTDGLRREARG
jgi:hypothetical protein